MTNLSNSTDLSKYMLDVDEAELRHDARGNSYFICKCYIDGNDHVGHIEATVSWEAVEAAADIEDFPTWYWQNQHTMDLYDYCADAVNKAQGRTVNYRGTHLPDPEPAMDLFEANLKTVSAFWSLMGDSYRSPKSAV